MDLAASIQAVTEEIVLRMGRGIYQQTGMQNLVLAGGVALNCVANGRLLREGPFDDIWIQPAAGDAGGALGAALFTWHQLLEKPAPCDRPRLAEGQLLGSGVLRSDDPEFSRPDENVECIRIDDEAGTRRVCRRAPGAGKGRRMVPGTHGVRSACPGRPQHHRRCAVPEDAGDDEPEDQVP